MKQSIPFVILFFCASLTACEGGLVLDDPEGTLQNTIPNKEPMIVGKDGKKKKTDPEVVEKLATKCNVRPTKLAGVPLRILTTTELNFALEELFPNLELEHYDMQTRDSSVGGFIRNSTGNVTSGHITDFRSMAESVATKVHDEVKKVANCTVEPTKELECIEHTIKTLAKKAFRRPLRSGEYEKLAALYKTGKDRRNHQEGMRYVVEAILQSPSFIYINEKAGTASLSGPEIAQHMASIFWQSGPDAELLKAAEAGDLLDNAKRLIQARRMVESDTGQRTMKLIISQWFGVNKLGSSTLSVGDAAILSSAELESEKLIEEILASGANWTKLLTADYSIVNKTMADHYGYDVSTAEDLGGDWYRVKKNYMAGLLTQSSFLAVSGTRSVHRGQTIWKNLLCGNIPGAPGKIEQIPTFEGESSRSKKEKRMNKGSCASCHLKMEPHGIVFDKFDSLGRYREKDKFDNALTQNGELLQKDGSLVAVDGPAQLAAKIAETKEARACVATHLFTWAFARPVTDNDSCEIFDIEHALLTNEDNLKEALIQVVAADEFINR